MSQLDSVSWRVDYTLSSSELRDVGEPLVHLLLRLRGGTTAAAVPVAVSADKFRVLLAGRPGGRGEGLRAGPLPHTTAPPPPLLLPTELKQAQALMQTLL